MANELVVEFETGVSLEQTQISFKNAKLAEHTVRIEELMTETKRNMMEIAVRLSIISEDHLYEADGYKDVFDYAGKVLGYKKNMVYKMIAVADKYIEPEPNESGYASIITHDDTDYTVSQLIELNTIDKDTAVELDENSVINPDMTTKEIREVVKDYKKGIIDKEGNIIGKDEVKTKEEEQIQEVDIKENKEEVIEESKNDKINRTNSTLTDIIKKLNIVIKENEEENFLRQFEIGVTLSGEQKDSINKKLSDIVNYLSKIKAI